MNVRLRRNGLVLTVCIAAIAVAGCGGGGGGGPRPEPVPIAPAPPPPPPPPPAPPPPPPPPASTNYDDAEYRRSNAATSSGAIAAWNAGATGRNVTVAVVDTGINPTLAEFSGRIHPASRDMVLSRGVADADGHGTAVSATIGAARNGTGPMGVAFDSTILSLNTSDPNDCDPDDGCQHHDPDIARAIDVARTNGARVVNISLGGDGVSSDVLQAVTRAAAAGMVIVMSAGNDAEPNPGTFAGDTARLAGNGHVIIAGSVGTATGGDPNNVDLGRLSTFSNQAGTSAQYYLTAQGYRIRTVDQNGSAVLYSGTSFSAPVISGAAALLAQAFPNLTGAQIVDILFKSADDLGSAGRDSTFGNGRLNIGRAMQPIGQTSAASTGQPIPVSDGGAPSAAMGDAVGRQRLGAVILDGFDRAFAVELTQTLNRSRARQEAPLAQGLQGDLQTGWARAGGTAVAITVRRNLNGQAQIGLAQAGISYEDSRRARAIAGFVVSRLSPETAVAFGLSESGQTLQRRLAGDGGLPFLVARDPMARAGFQADSGSAVGARHRLGRIGVTATIERGRVGDRDALIGTADAPYSIAALSADRRLGPVSLRAGASRLAEGETVLGGRFAFAPGGATTYFLDGSATYERGSWGAEASYRSGWTLLPGGTGMVRGGTLRSEAFALDLWRSGAFLRDDRIGLRLSQPLRVASGGYMLNLPVSYDYETLAVGTELQRFSLAPGGREIDAELAYGLPVLRGAGWLTANAFVRRQPGHVESMPTDTGAALRFRMGF